MSLPLTGGCWELLQVNSAAVVVGHGLDLDPAGRIVQYAQIASPNPAPGQSPTIVISAAGRTSTEAEKNLLLRFSRMPLISHANSFILGNKLVSQDISTVTDYLIRNRDVRKRTVLLVAANATPGEVMTTTVPVVPYSGLTWELMLSNQESYLGNYVPITLNDFLAKLAQPGIEPAVPMLIVIPAQTHGGEKTTQDSANKAAKNKAILQGMAVFKGNRMVGALNETESRGYRWMNSSHPSGGLLLIPYPLDSSRQITLEVRIFKHKTRPRLTDGKLCMEVDIEAELVFYEEQGEGQLLEPAMIGKIESLANEQITREISACISQSQKLRSDVLGWGLAVSRYQPDVWDSLEEDWPDIFPGLDYRLKVKSKITQSYLTNRNFQFN